MDTDLSAIGHLRRKYLVKKGWTQAELARVVGRHETTISFLFSERKGENGKRYLGRKPPKAGEASLADLVNTALEIPADELAAAMTEDTMREVLEGRRAARMQLAASVTEAYPEWVLTA